jgi:hypothetical protein
MEIVDVRRRKAFQRPVRRIVARMTVRCSFWSETRAQRQVGIGDVVAVGVFPCGLGAFHRGKGLVCDTLIRVEYAVYNYIRVIAPLFLLRIMMGSWYKY